MGFVNVGWIHDWLWLIPADWWHVWLTVLLGMTGPAFTCAVKHPAIQILKIQTKREAAGSAAPGLYLCT